MDQDNDDLSNWMMKCYEEKKTIVLIPRNMQVMNFIISGFSGFTFKTSILRKQMKNITNNYHHEASRSQTQIKYNLHNTNMCNMIKIS